MASQLNRTEIIELSKSRKNIIEILESRGFDVSKYKGTNINEISAMEAHNQLDMLIVKPDQTKRVYVKFHMKPSIKPIYIHNYVEDLFEIDHILEKSDDLIIITKEEPNDTTRNTLVSIWEQDGILINLIHIKRLQFNILKTAIVPQHIPLSYEESQRIKSQYFITDDTQLPDISRFDPVAQVLGIRPGLLCKIIRPSRTAIQSIFYRICINK